MLDFLCRAKGGAPRPSEENSESAYFPKEKVPGMIQAPAVRERLQAYLDYAGKPIYLEYVTWPGFQLKGKRAV